MSVGLVGKKCGMTRHFTETGESIPVTVVLVEPNIIVQLKTMENDGYNAVQVTTGKKHKNRINKPEAGHFAKAKVEAGRGLWEFTLADLGDYSVGHAFTLEELSEGQMVDVTGVSRGKGFAGTVKRYNFKTQDATHGNSLSHRVPGSTGQNQSPGRVFKGKKMAGQMGNVTRTVQNQKIVRIDQDKNVVLIKGVVPGAPGGDVIIHAAKKSKQADK